MRCRVTLKAEERIVVKMSKDGNIESSEVKGELKMMISDVESSYTVSTASTFAYMRPLESSFRRLTCSHHMKLTCSHHMKLT